MSYMKQTCCKNVLHKRHGQLGFHFLMFFFLKHGKEPESFIFCGIKSKIFGDKKDIVSAPYLTVFGFLAYDSLRILKSYGIVYLTLKTSLNIAGEKPCSIYKFQLLNLEHFFDES